MIWENAHDSALDTFLRLFAKKKDEGADKYGTDFENETFMMHRFCWCEKDDCPWCSDGAPNFLYKPLGFKVWWYKHIGRAVELNKHLTESEFKQMLADSGLLTTNEERIKKSTKEKK